MALITWRSILGAAFASENNPAVYNPGDHYQMGDVQKGSFYTLDDVTTILGHTVVDIMKFDIEGYEWNLLQAIARSRSLPEQIAFELHSKFANPKFVPAQLTVGKGRQAVAQLFLDFFQLGYRVVSKEVNHGDKGCAEFVLYRFPALAVSS
jgi:hypothetical protein